MSEGDTAARTMFKQIISRRRRLERWHCLFYVSFSADFGIL
jgi:hypothetical protein